MTGQELKEARQAAGMTQMQLAQRLELTVDAIRKLEQGSRKVDQMRAENFIRLAAALGIAPERLLESREETK